MKKKQKQLERFGDSEFQIKLPRRDYTKMSERQLLREGRRMYLGLQVAWRVELELPNPDWPVLESLSRQLQILEQGCPEVCEL